MNNTKPITSSTENGNIKIINCSFVSSASHYIWSRYENTLSSYVTRNSLILEENTIKPRNYELVIIPGAGSSSRVKSIT